MTTPTPFSLGSNGQGQLGVGHTEDVSIPKPVTFLPMPPTSGIKNISAGGNHTLILTKNGEVWAAGDQSAGACGILEHEVLDAAASNITAKHVFCRVSSLPKTVTHIACTWTATIVVCAEENSDFYHTQTVFSFGVGPKGELGRPAGLNGKDAVKIDNFPPPGTTVVDIASSFNHIVAVLSDGTAWGWGSGRKGQLGVGTGAVVEAPRRIPDIGFPVQRAVCGKEFTVLFGTPRSGSVLVLGGEKYGLGKNMPVTLPRWLDVGAGWSSVYVLAEDGQVLSWGRDAHGQLTPPGLPKSVEIAVGSEHVVALTEEGEVVSWGWGEHGNCGPTVGDGGIVKGKWNVLANSKFIKDGSRITGLGAGCATSWIIIETQGLVL